MLLPGKSCQRPEDGFVRAYDAQAAKRQIQISAALVLVLAAAAAMLGMFAPLSWPASPGRAMRGPGSAEDLLPSRARDGAGAGPSAASLKDEP